MSFDIFLQGFSDGAARELDGRKLRKLMEPRLRNEAGGNAELHFADGTADVYGLDEGALMFNHVGGEEAWDFLVKLARATNAAILPVGCPACVTDEGLLGELPDVLQEDACVVRSGAELRAAIDD